MNILHLTRDEKFILFFDSVFSSIPGVTNRYLVLGDSSRPFRHIVDLEVWRRVDKRYYFSREMAEDLAWADCLIVHFLGNGGAYMFLNAPSHVRTVWSGWGGDYYSLMPGGEERLFGVETARLIRRLKLQQLLKTNGLLPLVLDIIFAATSAQFIKLAAKKVNYFSSPIESDFHLLKKALGTKFGAKYVQLNYGSVDKTFLTGHNLPLGDDILVGNSATPSNNHIEVFKQLSATGVNNRKVVVPLSYGCNGYRDAVLNKGRQLLGDSFEPILDFMSLTKYNELISRCSIVVMNHRRQQALGNIGTMLYRGAKIFLDQESPVYDFFKDRGAHVYSTKLFTQKHEELFSRLNNTEITENRAVLESFWGHEVVINNARDFIRRMERDRRCRA